MNKWLVKNAMDITVYTTNIGLAGKVETNKEILVDGVKVWYFDLTWKGWQYSRALHKALKTNIKNFDIVHITSTFLAASYLGARYAKKSNVPYIISPRGNLMIIPLIMRSFFKKKIYLKLFEKRNLKNASLIHFTTRAEKQEYLNQNLPLKNSIVIPNGLDPEEFGKETVGKNKINFRERFGISSDKKIVLSLGRINWKKGFTTLIPAFAEVIKKEPNTVLVIAGEDDGYKNKVEKLIDKCNISRSVIFTGSILSENRIAAFRDSDVFVLPSYSENFGMVFIESMAAGTAVIGTAEVGIAPSIQEVRAGIIIERRTYEEGVEECKNSILKILQNPQEAKAMGERGRKLVEEKFMMPKIAKEWVDTYNSLIKKI